MFTNNWSFLRIAFFAITILLLGCKDESNKEALPASSACEMAVFSNYQQIMKLPAEDTMRLMGLQKLIKESTPACLAYSADSILNKVVYTWMAHPEKEKGIIDLLSWVGNNKDMNEKTRAKAFLNLSLLYSYKQNLGKMDSCLQLAWQYNPYFDNLTQREYCNFYGLCKLWQDSITEASTSFSKGIILGETVKAGDQTMTGLYGNYAMTFYQIWEYEKAASLYQKNLQLLETIIEDKTDLPITYLNLGACFIHLKQPDSAKAYLQKGIPLAEKNGTTNNIVLIYLYENLGAVFIAKGQYDSARYYLSKCNPSDSIGNNDNERAEIFISNTVANAPIKDVSKEVEQIKAYLPEVFKKYNYDILEASLLGLRRIAIIKKNPQEALEYTDRLDSFKEVQASTINKKIVHEMEVKYKTAKKDLQLEELKLNIEQKRDWIILLITTLLLGSLAALSISFRKKLVRRNKEVLMQQHFTSQLIAKTEEERTRIARDLHDSVSQELMLLKEKLLLGQAPIASIEAIIQEIRGISRNLHPEMLYKIGLEKTLIYLCEQTMENNQLFISYEMDYTYKLSKDKKLQLYRIVQESFNNTLKHAEAEAVKLTINQTTTEMHVEIKDNGKGFDLNSALASSKSFGLHSILARCEAINGKATITSTSNGTTINIKIPIL